MRRRKSRPRAAGRSGKKQVRSRGAFCVRALPTDHAQGFASRRKKGGGAPKGAIHPLAAPAQTSVRSLRHSSACAAAGDRRQVHAVCALIYFGARSPSGASPRLLSQRPNAATQPRPCFARTRGCRRYPRRQSRLSGAPRAPLVMPAGTMPKPPGSGVTSPARRNRTRPIHRLSPVDVPEVSEILLKYLNRGQLSMEM